MQSFLFSFNVIVYSLFLILSNYSYLISQDFKVDLKLIKEDDPEYKKGRLEWFKEMHRCEADLNWELMDKEARDSKYKNLQKDIQNLIHSGKNYNELIQSNNIDLGFLKGYWVEKGSNNLAGRIHTADVDFENNLIYAASAGGNIWRGTLIGQEWTCLNNSIKIKDIRTIKVVKNGSRKRIVVVGNSPAAIYYTEDEGQTWETAPGLAGPKRYGSFSKDVLTYKNNDIYVDGSEWDFNAWKSVTSVYRSTDKGTSFEPIAKYLELNTNHCDLWTSKYFETDVYFIRKDTLSRILEDGSITNDSFLKINQDFSNLSQTLLQGCIEDEYICLSVALYFSGEGKTYFYGSYDAGENWDYRGLVDFGPFNVNSFGMSNIISEKMYYGGVNLHRSYNAGYNWAAINLWNEYYADIENKLHADIPGIDVFLDPEGKEIILISTDGGLYISKDDLKTVKNISLSKLNVSQYYDIYTYSKDPKMIFAGSQDQGFQKTISGYIEEVATFKQTISGDYGHLTSSDGGEHLWCVYPGFLMLYRKLATDSYDSFFWNFGGKSWMWMPYTIADPVNPRAVYCAAGGYSFANNQNSSLLWRLVFNGYSLSETSYDYNFNSDTNNTRISSIGISEINPTYFYVLTNNGKFFYSTNPGKEWVRNENFNSPESHYFYGSTILTSKKEFGKLYIAGSGYSYPGVWVSDDNGLSFTPIDSGLPKTLIYGLDMDPNENLIFAATEIGPYVYSVRHNCWYSMTGPNSPDQLFWSVHYVQIGRAHV